MKNTSRALSLFIILTLIFSLTACFKPNVAPETLWDQATYKENTTLGNGTTTIEVEFVIEDRSVTITLKTDKSNLGDALCEHSLIDDPSYFVTANGITADWDANQAWWKVCQDGQVTNHGAGNLTLTNGDHYEIIYTVGF